MQVETRQRKVMVNGETKIQDYIVNVPVTTVVHKKENFSPSEKDRLVPVSTVQAFDLKGNPLDKAEWTKRLTTPQHVLLLREPIDETNKLNPFYAAILRDNILLLFLQADANDEPITLVYHVKDLPVWTKDGEALDPNAFVDLIKSKVTPQDWNEKSAIKPFPTSQSLVVTAKQKTHRALKNLLAEMRRKVAEPDK